MDRRDYYVECLDCAFDEAGADAYALWRGLTDDQRRAIGYTIEGGAENVGMAFYQPPPSDRYNQAEREWKLKYERLEREFEAYRGDAETAVKQALRQHHDARISIGKHGEVRKHDGRSDRIQ